MRNIKFRAFRKYPNPEMLYFTLEDIIFLRKPTDIIQEYEGIRETFMQYTDLKDRNGEEIYEGDILHIEISNNGKVIASNNEVVEYKDYKFGVVWGWHRDFIGLDGFCNTTFEVIGNIYKNPELVGD